MPSSYHSIICQYETDRQLVDALRSSVTKSSVVNHSISSGESTTLDTESINNSLTPSACNELEWTVNPFDANVTETQSMKEELKRLQVIKKYMILDADREEELERLTRSAGRIFDIPTSTINVVDIGRFFIMASHGVPLDIRETARKDSICSHTVWLKTKKTFSEPNDETPMLIVPDASLDYR